MVVARSLLLIAAAAITSGVVGSPAVAQTGQSAPSSPSATKAVAKPATQPAQPPKAQPEKPAAGEKSGQTIVALVNDEPISAFDVEQRVNLMLTSSRQVDEHVRANAQERWQRLAKDPKMNEEFQTFVQKRKPNSREEAVALQKEFVMGKQKAMVEELRREARSRAKGTVVKDAREQIIDERLKLQEAKRLGIPVTDADVTAAINEIAKKNNKDEKEFAAMLAGMGVNIVTMRDQIKSGIAWRDVVRRQFGHQISIGVRDVEKALATSGGAARHTELQLHKITLSFPPKSDEKARAARFAEAEALRKKFSTCKATPSLTQGVMNATFEDLGKLKAEAVSEPTRSVLLNAKVGEMTPASFSVAGVELYAVCNRVENAIDEKKREETQAELRSQEFELLARRHLKDLRQDAVIEYRQ